MKIYIILIILIIVLILLYYERVEYFENDKKKIDISLITDFYKNLTVISSKKRTIVIYDQYYLTNIFGCDQDCQDILNIIVFSRDVNFIKLKCKGSFNIGCYRTEILKMIQFCKMIKEKDIVIMSTKGFPFKIFSNVYDKIGQQGIKTINDLGAQTKIFRRDDNYLLIISKLKDIYYEFISPEPIYFPYFSVVEKKCKINPGNIAYPKDYVIFNDKSYGIDKVLKCAIEAHIRKYNKFGIYRDYCIPMSDEEYEKKYSIMADASNCVSYGGEISGQIDHNEDSVAGYSVDKIYEYKRILDNKDKGVIFFELENFGGRNFILNEGEYNSLDFNRQKIGSIYVPHNFYVFIIFGKKIVPFYGPFKVNLINFTKKYFDNIDTIVIQKHFKGNVVMCGTFDDKKICVTYGKGTHMLHPRLFIRYLSANLGSHKMLELHGNIVQTDLIQDFIKERDGQKVQIEYPRIVRSIRIK